MMSKINTKKPFSAQSNTFLIDHGSEAIRVHCLYCRNLCHSIELPKFTMFYCTSIFCTNTLELRYMMDGSWELHDYGAAVEELTDKEAMEKLVAPAFVQKPVLSIVK